MIQYIYKRAFNILTRIPVKLWGLSLLGSFLTIIVLILGSLPIIIIPAIALINAGMAKIYLDGYNGKEVSSEQMFVGFKNIKHVAGGMCWKKLWLFLWLLIPIAGIVMYVIKSLEYAFTPYILLEETEVGAMAALKKSMKDTKGLKLQMFGAIILPNIAFAVVIGILSLLAMIPFVGVIFSVISTLVYIAYSLLAPLFFGLVEAGFYDYAKTAAPKYTAPTLQSAAADGPTIVCPTCGRENRADNKFCMKCGSKL